MDNIGSFLAKSPETDMKYIRDKLTGSDFAKKAFGLVINKYMNIDLGMVRKIDPIMQDFWELLQKKIAPSPPEFPQMYAKANLGYLKAPIESGTYMGKPGPTLLKDIKTFMKTYKK